jgi:hypothetical protein
VTNTGRSRPLILSTDIYLAGFESRRSVVESQFTMVVVCRFCAERKGNEDVHTDLVVHHGTINNMMPVASGFFREFQVSQIESSSEKHRSHVTQNTCNYVGSSAVFKSLQHLQERCRVDREGVTKSEEAFCEERMAAPSLAQLVSGELGSSMRRRLEDRAFDTSMRISTNRAANIAPLWRGDRTAETKSIRKKDAL